MYCDHRARLGTPSKRTTEGDDLEDTPPSKRPRLRPTPSTHDLLQLISHPGDPPVELERSPKCTLEETNPTSAFPRKYQIIHWLLGVPRRIRRRNSAPGQLTAREALTGPSPDRDRSELLSPFQENTYPPSRVVRQSSGESMPSLGGRSFGRSSLASASASRYGTSNSIYRSILTNNGVRFDHTADKIPAELQQFLEMHIFKKRSSQVSAEVVKEAVNTAVDIADGSEGNVVELIETAMFPVARRELGRGSNTPWSPEGLPRKDGYDISLAIPRPDYHFGYPIGPRSSWRTQENNVIDQPAARPYTQPAKGNCLPFLVFEFKAEGSGGTMWQAENQAAGSGSHCVKAMRWLLQEAYRSEDLSIQDSIAFSICATQREALFYVHWYSQEDDIYYMSWIATCESMRHVEMSNHLTENIVRWGLEIRQARIREALGRLSPIPGHW